MRESDQTNENAPRVHREVNRYAKTHPKHWEKKAVKKTNGEGTEAKCYSVQIQFQGKRRWFALETPNRQKAGEKGLAIYSSLREKGWPETLAEFVPNSSEARAIVRVATATVGNVIEEACKLSDIGDSTAKAYALSFRTIVAEIRGIDDTGKRSSYGGNAAWKTKVEAVEIASITPTMVKKWLLGRKKAAGDDPDLSMAASKSANSLIRNARSLFKKQIREDLGKALDLPDVLPFDGVYMLKVTQKLYESEIDERTLVKAAADDLAEKDLEAYKIFLLGLFCGLRWGEINSLCWDAFGDGCKFLTLRPTVRYGLKTPSSARKVYLMDEIAARFQGWKVSQEGLGEFVVMPGKVEHAPTVDRAEPAHRVVLDWLRANGVNDIKAIHTMRKEAGSLMIQATGGSLYMAGRFLGHKSIATTEGFYASVKDPIPLEINARTVGS